MAHVIDHGVGPRANGEGLRGVVDGDEHWDASKELGLMEGKVRALSFIFMLKVNPGIVSTCAG